MQHHALKRIFNDVMCLILLRPVHGLIFLFKWTSEADTRPCLKESEGKLFFAKQVDENGKICMQMHEGHDDH